MTIESLWSISTPAEGQRKCKTEQNAIVIFFHVEKVLITKIPIWHFISYVVIIIIIYLFK